MAIEGPLKELGLHDVFQLLDLSRKTGVLRVTSQLRRNQGTVYFDSGAVIYAEIRSNPHPLGEMLVRAGKIDEADLRLAHERQLRGDRRRLGEILVDLKAVSQRDLERQVRVQIEEVIFEVMGWREGYFSFTDGLPSEVSGDALVRIRTEALLMEGARRIDEWSRIERQIPHLGVVPVLAPVGEGDDAELDLLPGEWEVLAAIDGKRSVREMATSLGGSEFDVAKVVFGLQSAGVVQVRNAGHGSEAEAAPPDVAAAIGRVDSLLTSRELEQARVEAERVLEAHPEVAIAHLAMGRVHVAALRARDAEESVRRALRLDPLLPVAHRMLGDALALQGRFAEAAEWWQRWLTVARVDDEENGERREAEDAVSAARTLDAFLRRPYDG